MRMSGRVRRIGNWVVIWRVDSTDIFALDCGKADGTHGKANRDES
jgi:hypothetical protein